MILVVCVDDRNGMMFGGRRQSRDRALLQRILEICTGQVLWMTAYTRKQFTDTGEVCIRTDAACFEKAGENEYCFVEDPALIGIEERIQEILCFRWNRVYPGDACLPICLSQWRRIQTSEFVGYSHEKITEERYTR